MPAGRAKALFSQFLATAVGEHKFTSASLTIHGSTGQLVPRFEQLVGCAARSGRFDRLTEAQCEQCIDAIIKEEELAAGESPFMLAQSFELSKWRIDGREVPTRSRVIMHYGQLPCISTFFQFAAVEEFQAIKHVLEDLSLCKLNEKYLRAVKAKKK